MLISDGFAAHETIPIWSFCFENNILLARLPAHTSHKLQPLDVAVFGPLKTAYRDQAERLERAGTNTIGKEHFTALYSPARERAITKKNIIAGWAKSGLFPLNPERVLKDIAKPPPAPPALTIVQPITVDATPRLLSEVIQTPATPVSRETLVPILDLVKQDPQDELSKQRQQRLINKIAKAAQVSFAKDVLQQDHIRFLVKMNDESKPRRDAKADKLAKGEGKVISYEDLDAKRAEKEAARQAKLAKANGKGKRGRKRKSAEADESEAGEITADIPKRAKRRRNRKTDQAEEERTAKMARMSEDTEPKAPDPKAPEALMTEAQQPRAPEVWMGEV